MTINGTARIFHATFCRSWYSNLRPSESCTSLRDIVPSPTHLHHNNQVCIGHISGLTKMDRLEAGSTKLDHSVNISSYRAFILIHVASALLGAAKWQHGSKMAAWQQNGTGPGSKTCPSFCLNKSSKKTGHKRNTFGQNFDPRTVFQKCTMAPVSGVCIVWNQRLGKKRQLIV